MVSQYVSLIHLLGRQELNTVCLLTATSFVIKSIQLLTFNTVMSLDAFVLNVWHKCIFQCNSYEET